MNQTRLLVTGAGGHLGGRLMKRCLSTQDFELRVNLRRQIPLPTWASTADVITGDLADGKIREELVNGVDVVLHLASGGYSARHRPSVELLEEELKTTIELARDSARLGVKRFIQISSIHVFGSALRNRVSTATIPTPVTPYGEVRLQTELELKKILDCSSTRLVTIRCTNTFGVPAFPRPDTWELLVHDACRQAVCNSLISLRSDARTAIDLLAIEDAAAFLLEISQIDKSVPESLILATGETLTIGDVAHQIRSIAASTLGLSVNVKFPEPVSPPPPWFALDTTDTDSLGMGKPQGRDGEIARLLQYAHNTFNGSSQL